MLRHTNTGGVSVLYVAHFGREREGGVAVNKKREKEKRERSVGTRVSHFILFHLGLFGTRPAALSRFII